MFYASLITLLPTLVFFLLLSRLPFLKSFLLKIAFSWFLGQFVFTWITFLLALFFSQFTINILQKASLVSLALSCLALLYFRKELKMFLPPPRSPFGHLGGALDGKNSIKILFVICILIFSFLFFHNQLLLQNGIIYTSPAYWDFQWHMPLIQNFVYGNNFPPQNESFAGLPQTYHFFWGLLVAIYSSVGLNLVSAINYVSIISLFVFLVSIVGISEELFKSFVVGVVAIILTITTSSLHFLSYILTVSEINPVILIYNLLTSTAHPYYNSLAAGNPFGYNGTMFNMFYFLAERQMIPGLLYVIFSIWVIYQRKYFSKRLLIILGSIMGLYFLWHLYITILVFSALLFVFIFDNDTKKTAYLLVSFAFFFLIHYLYFKHIEQSNWFLPDINNYPKINFNFPTLDQKYPFSITNAIFYYIYAYGLKLLLLGVGLFSLWKRNKKLFIILSAYILPTFILINTIQLSPLSIYDNHKWLRPMNCIIDIVASFCLYNIYFKSPKLRMRLIGVLLFLSVIASGFIELPPFLNAKPTNAFVYTNSPIVNIIRSKTAPHSIFVGNDTREIQLAGRKLFLGDYSGQDLRLDKEKRTQIIKEIYDANSRQEFCNLTQQKNIQYVEMSNKKNSIYLGVNLQTLPQIDTTNENNEQVVFIIVDNLCKY